MKSRGLLNVFGLLTIMLLILGVAYAHWTDTVVIEGTIHMGELIVGIREVCVTETTNGVPEDQFTPSKPWVANTTVTLEDEETSVHHDGETVYKKMIITIENAYPQYDVHIEFKLKNAGTIPAILTDCELTGKDLTDDEDLTLVWYPEPYYDGEKWIGAGYIEDAAGNVIVNICITAYLREDLQLEPCTDYDVIIDIDFKQTAEECHTYTFTVTVKFVQWNLAGRE